MSIEEIQTAIEASRQGTAPEPQQKIKKDPKDAFDYMDLILEKNAKLSGIIDLSRASTFDGFPLGNLGWAMHDFTNAIDQLVDNLWDHSVNIGLERGKDSATSTKE